MPLVLMCGLPSSGKSKRVAELVAYLKDNCEVDIHVLTEDFTNVTKNACYTSPREEKLKRGSLKSNVERHLTSDCIVILDSLNYIKGYRYELFCVSKHVKTTYCVILCETPTEEAKDWNSKRPENEKYSEEVFDALVMRFEPPNSQNRWDHPLFTLYPDDPLPGKDILDSLFHRKPPPPNQSTQTQPLSATNFLHELDRKTQEVVSNILEAQRTSVPGDDILVPGTSEKFHFLRNVSVAELRRLRRQFIGYTKLHPVENPENIPTLFVQYLNKSL